MIAPQSLHFDADVDCAFCVFWYSFCVLVAGFTRSVVFLWGTTFVCIVLTYSALAFGPPPPDGLLDMLYINRSFVALVLLLVTAILQGRLVQDRKPEQAQEELQRTNKELETRVTNEIGRRIKAEHSLQQAQKPK